MYSKTQTGKAPKGTVSVEAFQGRLRLRFRVDSRQKTFPMGLPDTPENRQIAEAKAREIERDLKADLIVPGTFDRTLVKYGRQPSQVKLTIVESINRPSISLAELWDKFVEWKRPQCSPNTMMNVYGVFSGYVKDLPTHDLNRVNEIRDWVVKNKPLDSGKRFITRLSACCDWAKKSKFITTNPFLGMAAEIKLPKSQKKSEEDSINPFTPEERDLIIEAFKTNKFCPQKSGFKYSWYTPYIRFLFFTGCRPNEATPLQWKHIDSDFRFINFEQALIKTAKGKQVRQGLKTQERRRFPCNASMQDFLKSIKPENVDPEALVFPSYKNTYMDIDNFRLRIWKPILAGLGIKYRKPYQMRHTFITLALENGLDAKDVAKLVGNSPEVIYQHYAGNKRNLVVPEF